MELLLGWTGLAFGAAITCALAYAHRPIAAPLLLGFLFRASVALVHNARIWSPPGGPADASRFERVAWEWAQLPLSEYLGRFDPGTSYVYSWLAAGVYRVTGRSELLLQSINVLLGTLTILVCYLLARRVMDGTVATRAAWVGALFPPVAFDAAITLRETVAILSFMLGLLYLVRWMDGGGPRMVLAALAGFVAATLFHGAWGVAVLGFGVVVILETVRAFGGLRGNPRERWQAAVTGLLGMALVLGVVAWGVTTNQRLGSVGSLEEVLVGDPFGALEGAAAGGLRGGSAYPATIGTADPISQPHLILPRVAYFLLSPFPWDIRTPRQALGMGAGLVYLAVLLALWNGRRRFRGNRKAQAILLILSLMIFVFAFGVSNIGTSLRHRSKFLFALWAIAGGRILSWRRARAPLVAVYPGAGWESVRSGSGLSARSNLASTAPGREPV